MTFHHLGPIVCHLLNMSAELQFCMNDFEKNYFTFHKFCQVLDNDRRKTNILYTRIVGPYGTSFIAEAASLRLPMVCYAQPQPHQEFSAPSPPFICLNLKAYIFLHPKTVSIFKNVGFTNIFLVELQTGTPFPMSGVLIFYCLNFRIMT